MKINLNALSFYAGLAAGTTYSGYLKAKEKLPSVDAIKSAIPSIEFDAKEQGQLFKAGIEVASVKHHHPELYQAVKDLTSQS